MSEERRAENLVERYEEEDEDLNEYELETDETEDLESAMKDALEAVERDEQLSHRPDDEPGTPAIAPIPPFADPVPAPAPEGMDSRGELVAALQEEVAELRERSVRTLAEFENYRKRVNREKADERRFREKEVLTDLLGVVDNLERAVSAEGSREDMQMGVELIVKQLHELLRAHGVHQIDAMDQRFDPQIHDAVSREESPDVDRPMVSEVMLQGYRMHEKLLRPAVVRVVMPASTEDGDA